MKKRAQKSNLASENSATDSINNEIFTQDDEIKLSFGNSDQISVPNNSSAYSNTFPSSASSSTAATTPVSNIAEYQDRIPSSNRKTNKALQQTTTAQVLEKYLASKKAKLVSPSDHIGAFFCCYGSNH
jgi:hypothetical protein